MSVIVRQMTSDDFAGVLALQPLCFPPPFPQDSVWEQSDLEAHLRIFPAGQHVAVLDGEIVGSSSCLVIPEESWTNLTDWYETVGGTEMENHSLQGTTLFGADISVSPNVRRQGVGRALYQARFDLCTQLGLKRFGTVCRLPDLAQHPQLSPQAYGEKVASGEFNDRVLTPLIRMGLTYKGIAEEYMDDDESRDCGAILERFFQQGAME